MSGHDLTLAHLYVCEWCHLYFQPAALDFSWRPVSRFKCPNCNQPWSSVPAPPAPPAVTHTGENG